MSISKSMPLSSALHLVQENTDQLEFRVDPHQEIASPAHYVAGRQIEPIQVIEDWDLNHHLACALKYIARAGRKHEEVKDLKKAVWYLERRIQLLEQQNEKGE